jgi:hypothetical protein
LKCLKTAIRKYVDGERPDGRLVLDDQHANRHDGLQKRESLSALLLTLIEASSIWRISLDFGPRRGG